MSHGKTIKLLRVMAGWLRARNLLTLGLLMLLAWLITGQSGQLLDWLITQEARLRVARQTHPFRLLAVTFALYFVSCYLPGTNGKAFVVGWLFGPLLGALLINMASTLAALGMFFGSRYLFQAAIESRYRGQLGHVSEHLHERGATYLIVLRMIPFVPYSLLNLLLGATTVRAGVFYWTTQLGMLPVNFGFAWVGASLPELRDLRDVGIGEILNPNLLGALAFMGVLPFAVRLALKRWQRHVS